MVGRDGAPRAPRAAFEAVTVAGVQLARSTLPRARV